MSPPITTRWLRRPVIAAALLATGILAAGGVLAPAEAQYYPYAYNPYYAAYCNPYYYPYGCQAAYGYPSYGYGYPSYGYGYPSYGYGYPSYGYGAVALGLGFGGGGHRGFRGGGGFHGGGGHGGGGHHR